MFVYLKKKYNFSSNYCENFRSMIQRILWKNRLVTKCFCEIILLLSIICHTLLMCTKESFEKIRNEPTKPISSFLSSQLVFHFEKKKKQIQISISLCIDDVCCISFLTNPLVIFIPFFCIKWKAQRFYCHLLKNSTYLHNSIVLHWTWMKWNIVSCRRIQLKSKTDCISARYYLTI